MADVATAAALLIVDMMLIDLSGRHLVSAGEVSDGLLELRLVLAQPAPFTPRP